MNFSIRNDGCTEIIIPGTCGRSHRVVKENGIVIARGCHVAGGIPPCCIPFDGTEFEADCIQCMCDQARELDSFGRR